jgi:hypothetical protein
MENSEQYLYSKMELDEEASLTMREPIGDVEYMRNGDVCVENEKLKVKFKYGFADYRDFVRGPDEIEGLLGNTDPSNDWRILEQFSIIDKQTNTEVDILTELPEGYRILFNPFLEVYNGNANVIEKGCLVKGDIASIAGILIILHEIGHCVDYERTDDKSEWRNARARIEDSSNYEKLKLVLLKERNAWAYALNKVRPFLRSGAFPKEEILKNIHGRSLFSYCDMIQEKMNKILAAETKEFEEFEVKLHELVGM